MDSWYDAITAVLQYYSTTVFMYKKWILLFGGYCLKYLEINGIWLRFASKWQGNK